MKNWLLLSNSLLMLIGLSACKEAGKGEEHKSNDTTQTLTIIQPADSIRKDSNIYLKQQDSTVPKTTQKEKAVKAKPAETTTEPRAREMPMPGMDYHAKQRMDSLRAAKRKKREE